MEDAVSSARIPEPNDQSSLVVIKVRISCSYVAAATCTGSMRAHVSVSPRFRYLEENKLVSNVSARSSSARSNEQFLCQRLSVKTSHIVRHC